MTEESVDQSNLTTIEYGEDPVDLGGDDGDASTRVAADEDDGFVGNLDDFGEFRQRRENKQHPAVDDSEGDNPTMHRSHYATTVNDEEEAVDQAREQLALSMGPPFSVTDRKARRAAGLVMTPGGDGDSKEEAKVPVKRAPSKSQPLQRLGSVPPLLPLASSVPAKRQPSATPSIARELDASTKKRKSTKDADAATAPITPPPSITTRPNTLMGEGLLKMQHKLFEDQKSLQLVVGAMQTSSRLLALRAVPLLLKFVNSEFDFDSSTLNWINSDPHGWLVKFIQSRLFDDVQRFSESSARQIAELERQLVKTEGKSETKGEDEAKKARTELETKRIGQVFQLVNSMLPLDYQIDLGSDSISIKDIRGRVRTLVARYKHWRTALLSVVPQEERPKMEHPGDIESIIGGFISRFAGWSAQYGSMAEQVRATKDELAVAVEAQKTDQPKIRELREENARLSEENAQLKAERAHGIATIEGLRGRLGAVTETAAGFEGIARSASEAATAASRGSEERKQQELKELDDTKAKLAKASHHNEQLLSSVETQDVELAKMEAKLLQATERIADTEAALNASNQQLVVFASQHPSDALTMVTLAAAQTQSDLERANAVATYSTASASNATAELRAAREQVVDQGVQLQQARSLLEWLMYYIRESSNRGLALKLIVDVNGDVKRIGFAGGVSSTTVSIPPSGGGGNEEKGGGGGGGQPPPPGLPSSRRSGGGGGGPPDDDGDDDNGTDASVPFARRLKPVSVNEVWRYDESLRRPLIWTRAAICEPFWGRCIRKLVYANAPHGALGRQFVLFMDSATNQGLTLGDALFRAAELGAPFKAYFVQLNAVVATYYEWCSTYLKGSHASGTRPTAAAELDADLSNGLIRQISTGLAALADLGEAVSSSPIRQWWTLDAADPRGKATGQLCGQLYQPHLSDMDNLSRLVLLDGGEELVSASRR